MDTKITGDELRGCGDWCRVGGRGGQEPNYGWPCVTGVIYFGDEEVRASNCIYCGKEIEGC